MSKAYLQILLFCVASAAFAQTPEAPQATPTETPTPEAAQTPAAETPPPEVRPVVPVAPARPLSPAEEEARQRYLRGVDLFDRGQPQLALEEFRRAYDVAPNYRVLYNLGLVNAQLGQAVQAIGHLEHYLRDGAGELSVERVSEVRAAIAEQQRRTASVRLSVNVSGATLRLDGQLVGVSPLQDVVRVTAGQHTFEARAEGHDPAQTSFRAAGGDTLEQSLTLRRRSEAQARLRLEGTLIGVVLRVDGEPVGTSPIHESIALTPGTHQLALERAGYVTKVVQRSVEAGEIIVLNCDLEIGEDQGVFRLLLPAGSARVRINGQEREERRMNLPVGDHTIQVEMAERQRYERSFRIRSGTPTSLAPVLRWTDESRRERLTPLGRWLLAWGVTGGGAVIAVTSAVLANRSAGELNSLRGDWQNANDALLQQRATPALVQEERAARALYDEEHGALRSQIVLRSSVAALGMITTVIGIVLLGKSRTEREVDLDAHVAASDEGATLQLRGSF